MYYIYCYENKINHHKYIGQTNNLKRRFLSHKNSAFNESSKDYNCLFHKKLRQYGIDNFDFYVVEELDTNDSDYVDFRESFWIQKLNTWCRYNQGYNETTGGKQYKKSLAISDEDIKQIKYLLKNTDLEMASIAKKFNTYRDCVSFINQGKYCYDNNESYPLRVTRTWREVPQEIKQAIAEEIINTKIPLKDLVKKYKVSEHLIVQINNGYSNLQGDYHYPLRKTNTITKEQEQIIYDGLLNKERLCDIARKAGVSTDTVRRRREKYNLNNL